jgi:hypothetical protein
MSYYFVYSDPEPKGPPKFNSKTPPDATKNWTKHYGNMCELQFMSKFSGVDGRPHLTMVEKNRITKEMQMCQAKLDWWSKRFGFNQREATAGAEEHKKLWGL